MIVELAFFIPIDLRVTSPHFWVGIGRSETLRLHLRMGRCILVLLGVGLGVLRVGLAVLFVWILHRVVVEGLLEVADGCWRLMHGRRLQVFLSVHGLRRKVLDGGSVLRLSLRLLEVRRVLLSRMGSVVAGRSKDVIGVSIFMMGVVVWMRLVSRALRVRIHHVEGATAGGRDSLGVQPVSFLGEVLLPGVGEVPVGGVVVVVGVLHGSLIFIF